MNSNTVNDFLKKIFGKHAFQENLRSFLEELSIFETDATTESKTTKIIVKELKEDFPDEQIVTGRKLAGSFNLKLAIEINGQVGLEVKLVKTLIKSPVNVVKFIGKAVCLQKKYGTHLYLLLVGAESDAQEPIMIELVEMLEDRKMNVFYIDWETAPAINENKTE